MTITVSMPEAALLRSIQAMFRRAPATLGDPPERIRPQAMHALQTIIRRGAVGALVRRGAWRSRRAIIDGSVREGRLWQLRPELELRFTSASFALCRWVAGATTPPPPPRTVGDALLAYLAADVAHRAGRDITPIAGSPLVALAFPAPTSWEILLGNPSGLLVLEALQDDLANAWTDMERAKSAMNASELARLGARQRAMLDAFLDAIDGVGRRDLAGFLVVAAARVVNRPARAWIAGVDPATGTLAERSEASRASAAFLTALTRLASWRSQWARVRFIDDGYDAAQLHLDAWDVLGQDGFERAARLADALTSLRESS